jgi:hypothetical protein
MLPSSKYRRKMVRTRSASSSTTMILRSLVAYPSGAMPPTQSPLRLEAAILSRMRYISQDCSRFCEDLRIRHGHGLAPSTFRRSPGAPVHSINIGHPSPPLGRTIKPTVRTFNLQDDRVRTAVR